MAVGQQPRGIVEIVCFGSNLHRHNYKFTGFQGGTIKSQDMGRRRS
jgi:hypothetical protein